MLLVAVSCVAPSATVAPPDNPTAAATPSPATVASDPPPSPTQPLPSAKPSAPEPPPTTTSPPTATPSPTPGRTPGQPRPIEGVVAPWIETTDVGLGHVTALLSTAERNGAYVLGNRQLWYSDDGIRWQLATMPTEPNVDRIHAITATRNGLVALGLDFSGDEALTHALVSADGRDWLLAGSFTGIGTYLAEIDGRLVAFGNVDWLSDPWYSDDGAATWQRLDSESGMKLANGVLALSHADGYLWAVRSENPIEDAGIRTPVELWRTTNGLDWAKVTDLPHSIAANDAAMISGLTGWLISARRITFSHYQQHNEWFAWHSADGINWPSAKNAPEYVNQVMADEQGFIAIGRDPGPCCALDKPNVRQKIWTSSDGTTWRQLSEKGWHGREIGFITLVGDRVLGVGIDWLLAPGPDGEGWGVVWEVDRAKLLP